MILYNLGLPKLSRPNFKKPCAVTGLRFIISIFRRFSTLTPPIPVPMTEVLVGVRRVFDTGWLGRVTGTLIWDTRSWICVPKRKFQNILPLQLRDLKNDFIFNFNFDDKMKILWIVWISCKINQHYSTPEKMSWANAHLNLCKLLETELRLAQRLTQLL